MSKLRFLGFGLIAAFFLAGCASKGKPAATEKPPAEKPKQEYVRQTQTGSWITRKVPKSQAQTSASDTDQAQQALGEWQRKANNQPDDPNTKAPRRETPPRN